MTEALVETFESSLAGVDVSRTRTEAAGLEAALETAACEPAVGAPLPFEDLALPDWIEEPTPGRLIEAATGVTAAGAAVAERGTVVVQSRPGGDEPVSLYPERHVAVVRASDVVADVAGALEWLAEEFRAGRDSAVFATGASATADMGALVEGVHGPRDVHVVIVTDR